MCFNQTTRAVLLSYLSLYWNVEKYDMKQNYCILFTLKLASAIFYQILIFSPNDSPLETMENVFYLI